MKEKESVKKGGKRKFQEISNFDESEEGKRGHYEVNLWRCFCIEIEYKKDRDSSWKKLLKDKKKILKEK